MTIHVVQEGETISMIADRYGVSSERLMLDNAIVEPNNLVVGEALVVLFPKITYTIQEGDTLVSIAERYGTTVIQLLRNNPYLSDRKYIYPGEEIVISYEDTKIKTIKTNSYAYPFINIDILRRTLPYLTYLTVLGYQMTDEGEINDIDDADIIQISKTYGVAPIMMLEAFSLNRQEEIRVLHSILISKEKQDRLIDNLLRILNDKGYSGVNLNTPYISPLDRILYENFITYLYSQVSKAGYKVYNTFTIRVFQLLSGTIFTGLDFSEISQSSDGIMLITYEYGYSEGIPPGTVSIDTLRRFLINTTEIIPPEKIFAGASIIGYIWEYPYIPGVSRGNAVSYNSAMQIASNNNAEIEFDETTNTAYFQYIVENEYIVRFWDARSAYNFIQLLQELEIGGISIWNIMTWFPQVWLIINAMYYIDNLQLRSEID